MSEKTVAAPAKMVDITSQNDLSAHVIASKFLQEISAGLKGDLVSASNAQDELQGIQKDPLQKQVLGQIATDMNDSAMMKSLGLTGSVNKDAGGNVTSLSFSSPDGVAAYNNQVLGLEKGGLTPTQAANQVAAQEGIFGNGFYQGTVTLNADGLTPAEDQQAQAPAAPAKPTEPASTDAPALGYPGSGISVNNGVDYNDMTF